MEAGRPLSAAERERMPNAGTVWLTPLATMRRMLEQAGFVVRRMGDCSASHGAAAASLLNAYAADAPAIASQIGQAALDDLLAAHRLWVEWLDSGRVRKVSVVAEKSKPGAWRHASAAPFGRKMRRPRLDARRPATHASNEHEPAGEAGGEHHHAVGDGGRGATTRAQAGRGEHPCGGAFARSPAADARQHHGQHREQRQRQEPRDRRGDSGRPRGDQEHDRIAEDGHDRRKRDRGQRVPVKQTVADVGHHRGSALAPSANARVPPCTRSTRMTPSGGCDQRNRHERHVRAHG